MKKQRNSCNQCCKEMRQCLGFGNIYVCSHESCPNYGVLQIPVEQMDKLYK